MYSLTSLSAFIQLNTGI